MEHGASTAEPTAGSTRPGWTARPQRRSRLPEAAEGVISTAIAVLIVAFLGIALWQGFELMMDSATQKTQDQVEQIGG